MTPNTNNEVNREMNMETTMKTARRLPSVAQMKNRMNSGHSLVLSAIAAGQEVIKPSDRAGDIRGKRTCVATLIGWEAISRDGNCFVVTERGKALL